MKRLLIFLVLFGLLSACQNPFKAPFNEQQNISQWIRKAETQISLGNWKEATQMSKQLTEGWGSIRKRISLNASSGDLTEMDMSIAQLAVLVKQEEKTLALVEVERLKQLWKSIASM
ncbi:DUF4363 family protein [Ammoniphilus sp. 3BR4]